MAFVRAKKGYVGICFNDFHVKKLRDRLIDLVVEAFGTTGDALFEPAFAAGKKSNPGPAPTPTPTPAPKKTALPKKSDGKKDSKKKDGKKKKIGKKDGKKKSSSSSSSSSSSGSSGSGKSA